MTLGEFVSKLTNESTEDDATDRLVSVPATKTEKYLFSKQLQNAVAESVIAGVDLRGVEENDSADGNENDVENEEQSNQNDEQSSEQSDDDKPNFEGLTPTQIKIIKALTESDEEAKFVCKLIREGKRLNNEMRILGRIAYGDEVYTIQLNPKLGVQPK
jgi:hypothetical protein